MHSIEGPRASLVKAYLRVRISMSGSVAGFIVCLVMHVARATMRCVGARPLRTHLGFRNQWLLQAAVKRKRPCIARGGERVIV